MAHGRAWFGACAVVCVIAGCSIDSDEKGVGGSAGTGAGGTSTSGGSGGMTSGGSAGSAPSGGSAGSSPTGGTGGGDAGSQDASADASSDAPAGDVVLVEVTLLKQLGEVFTPSAGSTLKKLSLGSKGTVYGWVRVELDVTVGEWQPDVPDPSNRTEHILFGLFRANQTKSDQRYLMGSAAVTFTAKAPHFRMFGRNTIGAGYTTYTSWSTTYAWQKGSLYHLDCLLDGIADVQRCELSLGGSVVKTLSGTVAYLDPALHLSSGLYVELGTGNPGDIEVSPLGWTFSNLMVTAGLAP